MEEKIYYDSTDNVRLCAMFNRAPDSKKAAILCHGITGDKDERDCFKVMSRELLKNGISSIRFDFRAHGESTGNYYEMTVTREAADVETTIKLLSKEGYDSIAVLGASFGGGVVSIVDYTKYKNVKALILWYGLLDYNMVSVDIFSEEKRKIAEKNGYSKTLSGFKLGLPLFDELRSIVPYERLAENDLPVLLLHGNADTTIPYQSSQKVAPMCKNSTLVIIENGEHTFFNSKKAFDEAIDKTVEFIKDNI